MNKVKKIRAPPEEVSTILFLFVIDLYVDPCIQFENQQIYYIYHNVMQKIYIKYFVIFETIIW